MKFLSHDTLHDRARHLEDAYFAERDYELLLSLSNRLSAEEARQMLIAATGVQDEIDLPGLVGLSAPQFLAVLGIFPMVEVAWCDGELGKNERRMIVQLTHEMGVLPGTPAHELMEHWLVQRPDENAGGRWEEYVRAIVATLQPTTAVILKERVIRRARRVASADGGIFNFGRMISSVEEACLLRLEGAFEKAAS